MEHFCPGTENISLRIFNYKIFRLEDGTCGMIAPDSQFIFGGEDSQLGDFPFTALIRMESLDNVSSRIFTGNIQNI